MMTIMKSLTSEMMRDEENSGTMDNMTYREAVDCIKDTLGGIGISAEEARSEAGLIIMHVCGKSIGYAVANGDEAVSEEEWTAVLGVLERRKKREPLQYILGTAGFADITVKCDRRALIPRYDTEILYNCVIDNIKDMDYPKILDLCTGSGCLALALKCAVDCEMYASDISDGALELAAENARKLGMDIKFIQSDMFDGISGSFDVICSNPPYIPSADIETLAEEVKGYEPRLALDGGDDGLDFYRRIAEEAPRFLKAGGLIALEIGFDQAVEVTDILKNYDVRIVKDYSGKDRVVLARLRR